MSVTGGSSRAIDSAAVPLHSAAPVAAPGSRRSSAMSRLLSRSSSIHTHFSSLTIRNWSTDPPGKGIAHYWPTAVPLPLPGNHGGNLEGSTAGTHSMSTTLLHARRLCPFLCGGHRQVARENLARRQPLAVHERTASQPELRNSDRLFWPGCPGCGKGTGIPSGSISRRVQACYAWRVTHDRAAALR
jgi:hypothetical protein